jgi:UDP-N-acetylglucosamine 2-epimerase (non-hydrolysing)
MILITYGTRPEWIKVKPLIDEMVKQEIPFKTLFTGQHENIVNGVSDYRHNMSDLVNNRLNNIVCNCLSIPNEYFNGITHILVQGDTTSALSLALNAFNRKIKIIHLEAGLRTNDFDNPYPEEGNRQLISRIADINLCPTEWNAKNLLHENVSDRKIFVVGNTGLDNLIDYKSRTSYEDIILVTLHRRENHHIINEWFKEINELAIEYPDIKFILPIHPNPNVMKYKNLLTNVEVVEPLSHGELLDILVRCKLVITDSGGLQEECSFLNKKCLVCRETTERPESIDKTSFMVPSPYLLKNMFKTQISNYTVNWESPFGDGYSSIKICKILKNG